MNVKELIALLKKVDGNATVLLSVAATDYELKDKLKEMETDPAKPKETWISGECLDQIDDNGDFVALEGSY